MGVRSVVRARIRSLVLVILLRRSVVNIFNISLFSFVKETLASCHVWGASNSVTGWGYREAFLRWIRFPRRAALVLIFVNVRLTLDSVHRRLLLLSGMMLNILLVIVNKVLMISNDWWYRPSPPYRVNSLLWRVWILPQSSLTLIICHPHSVLKVLCARKLAIWRDFLNTISSLMNLDWAVVVLTLRFLLGILALLLDCESAFNRRIRWVRPDLLSIVNNRSCLLFSFGVFALSKDLSFEVLERYHNHCNVVKRLSVKSVLKHTLDGKATLLVNWLCWAVAWVLLPLVFVAWFPDSSWNIFIWHFVKNSITCKHDEIVVVVYLKLTNFWLCFDNITVATSVCELSFRVTEGSWHREPSRQNSDGTNNVFGILSSWTSFLSTLVLARWDFCLAGIIFYHLSGGGLINLSTSLCYSFILLDVWWLVVSTKWHYNLTPIYRNNCPTVTNISTVAYLSDYQNDNSAWARSVNYCLHTILVPSLACL